MVTSSSGGNWKNPERPSESRNIFVVGFDPSDSIFDLPGVEKQRDLLRRPDVVLFDESSRPEFGPIPQLVRDAGPEGFHTEVANRNVHVAGLFELGTSFGIDASLVTSDLNFRRIFPDRQAGQIDVGLIHLERNASPDAVRDAVAAKLPPDVLVLTRADFVKREVDYWSGATPIGYVFSFGVIMGLVVGGIIVYQILFADVSEHLREYATLKAIGYTDLYLFGVVLQQALLLALLGFGPGLLASVLLDRRGRSARRSCPRDEPAARATACSRSRPRCASSPAPSRCVRSPGGPRRDLLSSAEARAVSRGRS